MGLKGGISFKDLEKLKSNLIEIENEIDLFIELCAKDIATRLLAKTVKRTPVGVYKSKTGKTGGTLRRGWEIGEIKKIGSVYEVELINTTHYASYVEFGHRTRGGKGFVKGVRMLTISENELRVDAPKIIEKKLKKLFEGAFKV